MSAGEGRRWPLALCLAGLALGLTAALLLPRWSAGRVTVTTVPRGTVVLSGGRELESPAVVAVPSEGLALSASAPGCRSLDTVIGPGAGEAVLSLSYRYPVRISSRPAGALVFARGLPVGATPLQADLPGPGRVPLVLVDTTSGFVLHDTLPLLSRRRRSVVYDLPVPALEGRMVYIPPMVHRLSAGAEGTRPARLQGFYISAEEVTVEEVCRFLNDADPGLASDSTCRQGHTLLSDSLFPADWDPGFRADTAGLVYHPRKGMEGHPVGCISLAGARAYCRWLQRRLSDSIPGIEVRLPTPLEWEAAARAGRTCTYPWGDAAPTGAEANISDSSEPLLIRCPGIDDGSPGLAPAGSYPPNPWGLRDMSGNLAEWCVTADGKAVVMGGSWLSDSTGCRCDSRAPADTAIAYPFVGFRPVAVLR